jgi:hypothetical protein
LSSADQRHLVLEEVQANPIPTERTLLFRAHQSNTTIQLGIYDSFACETSFGDQYQQQKSVEDFISSLGNHLGKTEREKEAGEPWETMFTSTSPRLDWTVHLTEQKWRKQEKQGMEDHVGFVTFDLQKLSETPDLTVLRVANVLRFLETRGKSRLIPFQYRKWAKNCDEYVLVGRNIQHSMLQISPWTKLQSMPIINDCFSYAYTLKRYDELWDAFMDEQSKRELGEACDMVVESAKTLADQKADDDAELVQNLVELIIKPGVRFWGIKTLSTDVEIKAGCKRMLEDELVVGMSRMSVRES